MNNFHPIYIPSTTQLALIAKQLPKLHWNTFFGEINGSAEGDLSAYVEARDEMPENTMHTATSPEGLHALLVKYEGSVETFVQDLETGHVLYKGKNQKLREVMEIGDGTQISLQSLLLLFAYFGPEMVVEYLQQEIDVLGTATPYEPKVEVVETAAPVVEAQSEVVAETLDSTEQTVSTDELSDTPSPRKWYTRCYPKAVGAVVASVAVVAIVAIGGGIAYAATRSAS